jgi:hypothetical protein
VKKQFALVLALPLSLAILLPIRASADENRNAWEHYDRGLKLLDVGAAPQEALIEFLQAYRIDPVPGPGRLIGMHYQQYDPEFQIARLYDRLGNAPEAKKFIDLCAHYGYTEKSTDKRDFDELRNRVATQISILQAQASARSPREAAAPPTSPPPASRPAEPKVTAASPPEPVSSAEKGGTGAKPAGPSRLASGSAVNARAAAPAKPTVWLAPLRQALRLYLEGSPRREVARAFEKARRAGAFREADRPGALYVAARFYAEEYVRTSDASDLARAREIYRRMRTAAPDYRPPAALREPKIDRMLSQ